MLLTCVIRSPRMARLLRQGDRDPRSRSIGSTTRSPTWSTAPSSGPCRGQRPRQRTTAPHGRSDAAGTSKLEQVARPARRPDARRGPDQRVARRGGAVGARDEGLPRHPGRRRHRGGGRLPRRVLPVLRQQGRARRARRHRALFHINGAFSQDPDDPPRELVRGTSVDRRRPSSLARELRHAPTRPRRPSSGCGSTPRSDDPRSAWSPPARSSGAAPGWSTSSHPRGFGDIDADALHHDRAARGPHQPRPPHGTLTGGVTIIERALVGID